MCLALAIPFAPTYLPKLPHLEISPISQIFFPVTIFSNSILLAAFTAVIIFVYNIFWRLRTGNKLFEGEQRSESLGKKILILITGYKVPIDKLKEKWHIYPLEDVEETAEKGARRKLIVVPRDEGRTATVERLDKAVQVGAIQDRIWASPGLPMLIFVTAGLIIALLFGDIVWIGVRFLLR
jgi:preflagellin peptidase FlaK